MIIANPLYDVVFKYLMEDMDIARELLSVILEEEILTMEFKPQETSIDDLPERLQMLRFDFKAAVRTSTGEIKKILIELQKARQALDVVRFRRYLGENYRQEDDFTLASGASGRGPLPIVTIYLLGFRLENILQPAVKINREYRDAITHETIDVKEDFVELLTHDSYIIQIPRLQRQTRTKLERALQIFSQDYRMEDRHQLDFRGDDQDSLVKKMIDRLGRANGTAEMRKRMDIEDELERLIGKKNQEIIEEREQKEAERRRANAAEEKANAAEEKANAAEEKANAAEGKANAAEEKANAAEEENQTLRRRLEELKRRSKE